MRRVVAALIFAVALIQTQWPADAQSQASCTFVAGFATLRDLVGAQKVGACLEDEHFNLENGNSEQRTAGGLLVWRKADNFTAFTDGGTTWVNGPNGLQSRPNSERFSWERDAGTGATASTSSSTTSSSGGAPAPASIVSSPVAASSSPAAVPAGSPVTAVSAPVGSASGGAVADVVPAPAAAAPASTSTPTPTAAVTATATATATKVTTPTPTPNPVSVKFSDKPNDVDTGSDQHIEVETNAKKATCTLTVTYHNTAAAAIATVDVDDGKCEWTWNLPDGTKTGRAQAQVTVTGSNGSASVDDDFDVNKGDTFLTGDTSVDLDLKDFPDDAKVGQEVKFSVESNLSNRGTCALTVSWPKVAATAGETKTPSDGKCSWTMTVPTTITKKGTASAVITVTNRSGVSRSVTKEFDVNLP